MGLEAGAPRCADNVIMANDAAVGLKHSSGLEHEQMAAVADALQLDQVTFLGDVAFGKNN